MITPENDASQIWEDAAAKGIAKYLKGQAEHKTAFWSAGAGWYANELENETLDLVSYFYHLRQRIKAISALSLMMEAEEISLRDASSLLKDLASDHPPRPRRKQSKD
jgi:hypothetical protein